MADKFQTLHPLGDRTTNVYPNIKSANIPNGAISQLKMGFHLYTNYCRVEWDTDSEDNYFVMNLIATRKIESERQLMDLFDENPHPVVANGLYRGHHITEIICDESSFRIHCDDGSYYDIDLNQESISFTSQIMEWF